MELLSICSPDPASLSWVTRGPPEPRRRAPSNPSRGAAATAGSDGGGAEAGVRVLPTFFPLLLPSLSHRTQPWSLGRFCRWRASLPGPASPDPPATGADLPSPGHLAPVAGRRLSSTSRLGCRWIHHPWAQIRANRARRACFYRRSSSSLVTGAALGAAARLPAPVNGSASLRLGFVPPSLGPRRDGSPSPGATAMSS